MLKSLLEELEAPEDLYLTVLDHEQNPRLFSHHDSEGKLFLVVYLYDDAFDVMDQFNPNEIGPTKLSYIMQELRRFVVGKDFSLAKRTGVMIMPGEIFIPI